MSKFIRAIAIAAMFAAPAISFAQSTSGVTRAQVRAELASVEAAGYSPGAGDDANYPVDLQAAEAKVAMEAGHSNGTASIGGMPTNGTSAAGGTSQKQVASRCNGPIAFCDIYFGS